MASRNYQSSAFRLQKLVSIMSSTLGGSNILRGGKRTYDCKTLVGNFVEEAYRPDALTSKWDGGPMYETSTRQQMQEGAGVVTRTFGAGLRPQDDVKYDYHKIVGMDKTRGSGTWESLVQSAHCNRSTVRWCW
jgi:hypothetical protein